MSDLIERQRSCSPPCLEDEEMCVDAINALVAKDREIERRLTAIEYDCIDLDYDKQDAFEGGVKSGFFAGTCFGFLVGALVMGLLVSLS